MTTTSIAERSGERAVQQNDHRAVRTALKNSLYPGATDDSVDMVIEYCKAARLDPMTKPVHLVPMRVKDAKTGNYEWRDVVMPGIELYRTKAHRTGEYAGMDKPEFGQTMQAEFAKGQPFHYPEYCTVIVYRTIQGNRVPFPGTAHWLETYAQRGKDDPRPNAMWSKRPWGQIEKCAEALALRRAFPEAVGAQPTADEMEGKSLHVDDAPTGNLLTHTAQDNSGPSEEARQAVINTALEHASHGREAFLNWWQKLEKADRALLTTADMDRVRERAEEADQEQERGRDTQEDATYTDTEEATDA